MVKFSEKKINVRKFSCEYPYASENEKLLAQHKNCLSQMTAQNFFQALLLAFKVSEKSLKYQI